MQSPAAIKGCTELGTWEPPLGPDPTSNLFLGQHREVQTQGSTSPPFPKQTNHASPLEGQSPHSSVALHTISLPLPLLLGQQEEPRSPLSCFWLSAWAHVCLVLPVKSPLVIIGFLENDMTWRRFGVPFLSEL